MHSIALSVFLALVPLICQAASLNITWVPSPNYGVRLDKATGTIVTTPTILVLHYTVSDLNRTFDIFQSNASQVSSHYTIAENGDIYQHVDEKNRAWHAGAGNWRDVRDVNTYSVGIEIVNAGYKTDPSQPPGIVVNGSTYQWYPYQPKQMQSVIDLSADIVKRYGIKPRNVIGHSDLAPGRKQDPGPLFPWSTLAKNGIGAWTDEQVSANQTNSSNNVLEIQKKLQQYGYTAVPTTGVLDSETRQTLGAFQMHFRPSNIGGMIDTETASILDDLLRKFD